MKAKGRGYDIDASGLGLLSAGHIIPNMKAKWDDVLYMKHVEGTRTFALHYYGIDTEFKSIKSTLRRVNKTHQIKVDQKDVETVKKLCKQCIPDVKVTNRKRTLFELQFMPLIISVVIILATLFAGFAINNIGLTLAIGFGASLLLNIVSFIIADKSKMITVYKPRVKPSRYQLPF